MDEQQLRLNNKIIQRVYLGDMTLYTIQAEYIKEYQSLIGLNRFDINERIFSHIEINGLSVIYEKENIGELECYIVKDSKRFHIHVEHRIIGVAAKLGIEKDKKLYAYSIKQVTEDYIKELIATELIEKNKGLCPYAISFKTGF